MVRIGALICVVLLLGVVPALCQPLVLIDQGHGQRFLIEETGDLQLSGLAEMLRLSGNTTVSTTKPLTDSLLQDAAALVISGAFRPIAAEEVASIVRFVERGGRLAVMLHIGSPFARLLEQLGVDFSNAVLHEQRNTIDQDINFRLHDLASDPLFGGLDSFALYGGWALNPGPGVAVLARTSEKAWVDLDGSKTLTKGDAVGAFPVVVSGRKGAGSFIVFGDDAIFQNRYLDQNNRRLAGNLGGWLAGR